MARTIRKKATKRNHFNVKYGNHKYDKWFKIYPGYKTRKNRSKLHYAHVRLNRILIYEQLRMNDKLLIAQGLASLNWTYVKGYKNKNEMESKCNALLPLIRTCVSMMLKEKGNDPDLGYTNLYLYDRIIKANDCYKKCDDRTCAYYYGDPEDKERFLMREEDDEFKGEWEWTQ
eukprot:88555_1